MKALKIRRRWWTWCIVAVAAYTLGYALLMDRRLPAIDENYEIAFDFSSKYGAFGFVHVGYTLGYRRVTFLNYVFIPANHVYRWFVPASTNSVYYEKFPVRAAGRE